MSPFTQYDVAVIGAGHNALVAAALLARAGRSVIVLEQGATVGGSVATEEFAPGFRAPLCFAGVELFHPKLIGDLELEKHGLRLLPDRGGTGMPLANGRWLGLGGPDNGLPAKDRAALAAFASFTARMARVLAPLQTGPLPALRAKGFGDMLEFLKLAVRLRGLGARDLGEMLRFLPMPVQDVLDERFENDALKAALAMPALTGAWLGPRSAGSAWGLLHHRPAWRNGLLAPPRFAAGGPGALTAALAASASAHGADIRTGTRVRAILVEDRAATAAGEGSARAIGVLLEDGREIPSRTVVSGADPRSTLLDLVGPRWLDPEVVRAVGNLRAHGSVAIVKLALDRKPRFEGAPEGDAHLAGRIRIGASLEYLERAFDCAKYGRVPERPVLEITLPSLADGSLAPAGRHVMHVWVQYTASDLRETSWESARESLGRTVIGLIGEHAPDFADSVLHTDVLTPLDIEQRFGLSGGCLYHADMTLDQLLYMRPLPGWYRYRTPIDNLYLCGPGTHPGGGVTGLPGRNAASRVQMPVAGTRPAARLMA
ncbi:MAG TPA: NAD(P)/FAD-dependent oxidoreductase [Gammaproteobacteria bacterium]|nr:NAD(P)/FAD-dependent oxidoreductase [Gammaproteobacteria bacterium]